VIDLKQRKMTSLAVPCSIGGGGGGESSAAANSKPHFATNSRARKLNQFLGV
jgi:hypothetical protein